MLKLGCALGGLLIGAVPALAQDAPRPAEAAQLQDSAPDGVPEDEAEIVVSGEIPGEVIGDIPPEQQLSPADIRAYGVSNIGELVAELAPQTSSGRGRGGRGGGGGPVILVDGRRVSSFREIRELPTEAVLRVDIFPEEVALKYGYSADQRVVNIVLRPRFKAITAELTGKVPTAGGASEREAELNILRISKGQRVSLGMEYSAASGLLESERDVISTRSPELFDTTGNITAPGGGEIDPALSAMAGEPVTIAGVPLTAAGGAPALGDFAANQRNTTDLSPYRTLSSPSEDLTLNAVYSRALSTHVTATLNGELKAGNRESLLGLPGVTLELPAGNPFSPFADNVLLSRYPDAASPLTRNSSSRSVHLGFSVNGDLSKWRWSLTGNYDRANSRSITATGFDASPFQAELDAGSASANPFGPIAIGQLGILPADLARSVSSTSSIDALVNGPLAKLPAGDIALSVRATGRMSDYESSSFRSGVTRASDVSRDSGSVQANLDLPITSRREGVLDAIGDLSLNANVQIEQLSDFGRLVTTGYGAVWSPIEQLRFIASFTDEDGAPSSQQLGDPIVSTPNVRVFDYVRGESVDVTSISGGNPGLGADSRHVMKLGLNARPIADKDLTLTAEYVRSTTRNQISGFPAATAEVEAAFPQRFMRDADGRLIGIDTRAVNFARAEHEEFRWGFRLSMPITSSLEKTVSRYREQVEEARAAGKEPPPPPESLQRLRRNRPGQNEQNGAAAQNGDPGRNGQDSHRSGEGARQNGESSTNGEQTQPPRGAAGGGFRGRGRGLGRFGGANGRLAGRLQFALYHTLHLKEQVVIDPLLPSLDLLNGSATGSRGGQSRHEIEGQAGFTKDGLGVRLSAKWQSGTEVDSGTLGSGETLRFSDLGTINLRLFADMGQQLSLVRDHRWLRGMRVTLSVDNLFDARQRVTDAMGVVPLSYQPDLLDPMGRTIRLSVRKVFF